MKHPASPIALALVLLLPALATATPTHGTVTAESATLPAASDLTGDLSVLMLTRGGNGDPAAPPGFDLAGTLNVQTDHAERYAADGALGPVETRTLHQGPGTLSGNSNGPAYKFWLVPLPGEPTPQVVAHESLDVQVTPSSEPQERIAPEVDFSRPEQSASTARSVVLDSAHPLTLTVHGDFGLILWEWDAVLTHDGQERAVDTGVNETVSGTGVGSADEAYITAHDATLTITLRPETYRLYLDAVQASADSALLTQATGTLPGIIDADGDDVTLRGDLTLDLFGTGTNRPVAVDVAGDVQTASLDGIPVAVTPPPVPGGTPFGIQLWLWGAGVLLLAVAAYASRFTVVYFVTERRGAPIGQGEAINLREAHATGKWIVAARRIDQKHTRGVIRLCNATRKARPDFPDAYFTLGQAHVLQGDTGAATSCFELAYRRFTNAIMKATCAVSIARLRLEEGPSKAVIEWLLAAKRYDPAVVQEAVQDPAWNALPAAILLKSLREGPEPDVQYQ